MINKLIAAVIGLMSTGSVWAAAPAQAPSVGQGIMQMLPMFVIFIAIFYFLMIRPQNKKAKEKKQLLDSLKTGDEIITTGGIVAKIKQLTDAYVILKVGESAEITLQRGAIAAVLPIGTLDSIK